MRVDVCVIGAGPAGLSAAAFLAERGKQVLVVDEMPAAGGRLLGQLHKVGDRDDEYHRQGWWIGRSIAGALYERATRAGAQFLLGHSVWGLFPRWNVYVTGPRAEIVETPTVLLATGAAEVPVPVLGWTLPGVMSIGAAQVMVTQHRVKPGRRVLIAGINLLSIAIAHELQLGGVEVVAIVNLPDSVVSAEQETEPAAILGQLAQAAHLAPSPLLRAAGGLARFSFVSRVGAWVLPTRGVTAWRIPIQPKRALIEIRGTDEVESVVLATRGRNGKPGKTVEIAVDTVCIAGGLRPLAELATMAGCAADVIPGLGGLVPLHGTGFETTEPGLYVAGNITGIESAPVAIAQGRVAAAAIAEPALLPQLKAIEAMTRAEVPIQFMPEIVAGREDMVRRWHAWGSAVPDYTPRPARLPSPSQPRTVIPDDLVLCRCEEVTGHCIQAACAQGLVSQEELKRFSRMTMGACQGRICQGILRQASKALLGSEEGAAPRSGHRPPIRPLTVAELAAYATGDEERERLTGRLRPELSYDDFPLSVSQMRESENTRGAPAVEIPTREE